MNERIQQLADKALQLVADEHTGGDESRLNTDSYHVKDLIQAKFAELLIQECGVIADIYRDIEARSWPSKVMKEHFGVEE
jgi:hypothetical protein